MTIENGLLQVLQGEATVLWSRGFTDLNTEIFRSEHRDLFLFEDLDGDGAKELLLNHVPEDHFSNHSSLMHFDEHGKMTWTYPYGRELRMSGQVIDSYYAGGLLRLLPSPSGAL